MTRDDLLHLLATDAVVRQVIAELVMDVPLASRPQFEILGRSLAVGDAAAPDWTATIVPPGDLCTALWVHHDP